MGPAPAQDLFVVNLPARIRTLPQASAPMEIAVDAGLKSLRENAAALYREQAAGETGAWPISLRDLEEASRSLLEKCLHLDPTSPYSEHVHYTLRLLAETAPTLD